MTQRIAAFLACAGLTGLLAACGDNNQTGGPHRNAHLGPVPGQSSGGGLTLFSTAKPEQQDLGSQIGVNAYLWRGALETLKFMPLANADPFGGVIITDWWTPPASPSERFKATAYVLSRQLRADGIRISLFRQVQQNGQWIDAPVEAAKPTELENMVLAKARELRSQTSSAQ